MLVPWLLFDPRYNCFGMHVFSLSSVSLYAWAFAIGWSWVCLGDVWHAFALVQAARGWAGASAFASGPCACHASMGCPEAPSPCMHLPLREAAELGQTQLHTNNI